MKLHLAHLGRLREAFLPGLALLGSAACLPASDDGSASGESSGTTGELRERAPLVDANLWEPDEATDDPFPDHRPAGVSCFSNGAYPEGASFEVDTGLCNYASLRQPSLVDVVAGDEIHVSALHGPLASTDLPASGHMALVVGESVVWEVEVPIEAGGTDAAPYNEAIAVSNDVPAGTPVHLHVHNHGYNTWKLVLTDVVPPGAG